MSAIEFRITDKPSNSKGWARYAVGQDGRKVVQSNTGNEWVSSPKDGQADGGSKITLRAQVMLRVGKGRTAREEVSTEDHVLIVEDGASCTIQFRPGSQGITIAVAGARLATD